ncbi:hypothetical protein BDN70DRAFT_812128 [Pholiota conissans]|uniref:HMG domain-containing protein n=1 Tax=Pholiota conissans TaxID=109636 RepID=A0A9P5YXM4_9AGAR|nr:hypothetical protein BDN70DRAFT_812128 [Pholiota conissans]
MVKPRAPNTTQRLSSTLIQSSTPSDNVSNANDTSQTLSSTSFDDGLLEGYYPSTPDDQQYHYFDDADALPQHEESRKYSIFVDAVASDQCSFLQLTQDIFIANGWNINKDEATTKWYHIHSIPVGDKQTTACLCPQGKDNGRCFHARYLDDFKDLKFPSDEHNKNQTFMCSRYEDVRDGVYICTFSVPPPPGRSSSTIKQRSVVTYYGDDSGKGTWSCSIDVSAISCSHIVLARHSLRQHIKADPDAHDSDAGSGDLEYRSLTPPSLIRRASSSENSISTLLLPPPLWARVKRDLIMFDPPFFDIWKSPKVIPLDEASSCSCQVLRSAFDPLQPTITRECTIYALDGAVNATIQVQKCPTCTHRYIGPDGRSLGLFNWNNRTLFTHDLLDDYTSQYTTSETPFISWVTVISRRYQSRGINIPFIGDQLFRAVWFSYIRLVQLDNDMICPTCGPNPEVTIVDGVTLAFNRRHLSSTLRPPTTTDNQSPTKDLVKHVANLQAIPTKKVRLAIREILTGPPLLPAHLIHAGEEEGAIELSDASSSEDETTETSYRHTRKGNDVRAALQRVQKIPFVITELAKLNNGLSRLFDRSYGIEAISANQKAPSIYKRLFIQIAAEETILQLVNGSALRHLRNFCAEVAQTPHMITASIRDLATHLIGIPALHAVIQHEINAGSLSGEVIGTSTWLYARGMAVMSLIKKYDHPPIEINSGNEIASEKWNLTGCCYGLPQIRHRPRYPNLPYENGRDAGGKDKRGDGCQKFYSTYGQSRLTGGIMCVWCTHSVCYGFHCIPSAEGRNDVFSAFYTRWEKAPKVIVYDFACALQPYCMTREPAFFADTLFVIDAFHAMGHTKCGQAAFLNTYCDADPTLLYINSSAAECGNGGILRIRKAVSYMAQERAIVFTKTFLSIWNRHRIRNMERLSKV